MKELSIEEMATVKGGWFKNGKDKKNGHKRWSWKNGRKNGKHDFKDRFKKDKDDTDNGFDRKKDDDKKFICCGCVCA